MLRGTDGALAAFSIEYRSTEHVLRAHEYTGTGHMQKTHGWLTGFACLGQRGNPLEGDKQL